MMVPYESAKVWITEPQKLLFQTLTDGASSQHSPNVSWSVTTRDALSEEIEALRALRRVSDKLLVVRIRLTNDGPPASVAFWVQADAPIVAHVIPTGGLMVFDDDGQLIKDPVRHFSYRRTANFTIRELPTPAEGDLAFYFDRGVGFEIRCFVNEVGVAPKPWPKEVDSNASLFGEKVRDADTDK